MSLLLLLTLAGLFCFSSLLSSPISPLNMSDESAQETTSRVKAGLTNTFVPIKYSVVPNLFIQDDPTANLDGYNLLNDSFGLLDKTPERWSNLTAYLNTLNQEADDRTSYKLIYIARHGEGYHNVAEAKYGSDEWNKYWSKLDGDGNITWGPDAHLTPLGEEQAKLVNLAWKHELLSNVPLPQSLYSSPLRRSANTLNITWSDILLSQSTSKAQKPVIPLIKEGLREMIGVHTCDKRSDKSVIQAEHPTWQIEEGFTEHDELWTPDVMETEAQQAARTQLVLNEVFANDPNAIISITAHSGTINAFFTVTGHRKFHVLPGGFVPVLVKATGYSNDTQPIVADGTSTSASTWSAATESPASPMKPDAQRQYVFAGPPQR